MVCMHHLTVIKPPRNMERICAAMQETQRIAELLRKDVDVKELIGKTVRVNGWVRTRRDSKAGICFIELNDGSCLKNLQIIVELADASLQEALAGVTTGASLSAEGELVASPGKGQAVELHVRELQVIGLADPGTYPLQKKRHSFEFLRQIGHLRPRTNTLGAVTRVRSRLSFAIHQFFQERHFCYLHTPIITSSDCEGAGEVFRITAGAQAGQPGQFAEGVEEFFGKPAYLTVSGQLQAEIYALAMGKVYTFGPTFRAENSNTSRHLAEFWMVEPEMAFCDLEGDLALAQELVKVLVGVALKDCAEDLEFFTRFVDESLPGTLDAVVRKPFEVITYTDAIERLKKSGETFAYPVEWGMDLQSEHERYLTEKVFQRPVAVIHFPRSLKPFYMRVNDDEKTVAAMDILVPGTGEIVGGSQREERADMLEEQMRLKSVSIEDYQWYLDLRRYGSAPHAGFGLGLERMVQFVTGLPNIREVIPFPRTPGHADF